MDKENTPHEMNPDLQFTNADFRKNQPRQKKIQYAGRLFPLGILILYSSALLMLILCGCVFLYPRIESFDTDQKLIRKGETAFLHWDISPSVDTLVLAGETEQKFSRNTGGFTVTPLKTITYSLTAENWFSRFLHRKIRKEITIQVISALPTIDLLKADVTTINGDESAMLRWSVGEQADQVTLSIGSEKSALSRTQFTAERSISLKEGAYVSLQAKNTSGKMIKSIFVRPSHEKPVLKKFILWVNPQSKKTSDFSQKYAELIPDESATVSYRLLEYQPERNLQAGEEILLEWQAEGVSSVILEPLSETPLSPAGSQIVTLSRSMNFLLTLRNGTENRLYVLPVVVGDTQKETAPEIEFFKANPVEIQGSGDVILSWSVAGKWTRIQLLASDPSVRSDSESFSTPAAAPGIFYSSDDLSIQSRGLLITEALYPAGFLTIHISKETSFILKAWNGMYSDSANVDIRVDPSESEPQTIQLEIRKILPEASAYSIGETVAVYTEFSELSPSAAYPTGTILVNDGTASCIITLPRNSCNLTFVSTGVKEISARYLGDSRYSPAAAKKGPLIIQEKPSPSLKISGLFPDQSAYTVGDTVDVHVLLSQERFADHPPEGKIKVTDGTSACWIAADNASQCSLSLIDLDASQISASYAGDTFYAPSSSEPFPIQVAAHSGVPTTTTISGVLPDQEMYEIGDELEIFVNVVPRESRSESLSGTITVTNGYSSCTIKPGGENACRLKLISSLSTAVTAAYSGDANYAPSTSEPFPIQVAAHSGVPTTTTISGVLPDQEMYEIGDELEIFVNVLPQESRSERISGTITVTDGYSSCTIKPGGDNFCTLKLINSLASQIIAVFSGDDIFAASQSEPFPIMISMINISASLQSMKFSDCNTYIADPEHQIMSQTDPSLSPVVRYFTLDSSFLAGSGFFVNLSLSTKSGQFGTNPGTVSGLLCSKTDPDYCIASSAVTVVRDRLNFTQAAAVIEFPVVHQSGNFILKINYSGDGILFGENSVIFEVRGIQKAFLMLMPAGITDPANFSLPSIRWPDITASELHGTSYAFNAFYLKGGKVDCPIQLDISTFPKPRGFHIKVNVADSVFGADQTDSAWQSLLTANGYESEVIARMQPNSMDWQPSACTWQNGGNHWQIRCEEVGIMEPSTLTYAADEQDPNYQVFNSNDADRDSDLFIQAEISRYLSYVDVGHLTQPLSADTVYWINFRKGTVFDKLVGKYCSDIINPSGTRTVSYYLLDSSGEPSSQVINLTPFLLSRSQINPAMSYRTPAIEAPVAINASGGISAISVLLPYFGHTTEGQIIDLNAKARIKNYGCSISGENSITVTSFSGTLSDGVDCNDGTGIHVSVSSSFCQLSFTASADSLPVIVSFAGNDAAVGSQKEITLDVSAPAGVNRLMTAPKSFEETAVVSQPVTVRPTLLDTSTTSVAYSLFTGDEYLMKLTTSVPLSADVRISANLPPILSEAFLDPEKSSCLDFIDADFSRLTIPGDEFRSENSNTFTCSIVFSAETVFSGLQTMNFELESSSEDAAAFQMTPFSWSGLPTSVNRHSLTHLLQISDTAGNILCSSMASACGSLYTGDVYQLTVQVPAFSDENTVRLINSLNETEELGQAVISWPEDWAESIRTSHAIQNQNGIKDLCPIDASNQTILAITHETDTHVAQISCHFVLGPILPSAAGTLQSSIRSPRFQFQDAPLFLPGSVGKRTVTLRPSLILQMNPQEASPITEEISNHQINRLYRDIHPSSSQQAFSGGIAAYTLSGSVSGVPQNSTPLPSDQILVQWSILDILFSMGELPSCFSPSGDGWYQLGILSAGADGTWSASCPLQFPSTIPDDTASGIFTMRLQSAFYEDSAEIEIAANPFHKETVHAVVSVPQQLKVSTDYNLEVNLNPSSAPLSDYARALLQYDTSLQIIPVWIHQSTLKCNQWMQWDESFQASCAFRFDTIPEINTESAISFTIATVIPADLLSFVLESASTAERQDVYPMPPVSKMDVTLRTRLFHQETEVPIPAMDGGAYMIQDLYKLQIQAECPDTEDPVSCMMLQNTLVRIEWPLLANPIFVGSCADPSGSISLAFHNEDLSGQMIAECSFSLTQGDLLLADSEKLLSIRLEAPQFETAYEPQEQPIQMPGNIQKKQPVLTFSPIYQIGNPDRFFENRIPIGSDAVIDLTFDGDPSTYTPDLLVVQTNFGETLDCTNSGTTKTCRIPANCTDGAPLADGVPYPEICSAEISIHANYPGDIIHQAAEADSSDFIIIRNTMDIMIQPDNQFAKEFLHSIWQSAEDGQSWNVAAITAGGWELDTFLIRDVHSLSSGIQTRSYPIQAVFQSSNPSVVPDPALFRLDIVSRKSNYGSISEETISLKPAAADLSGNNLLFQLDFGETAMAEDGIIIADKMAQIMSIEAISIRYAGDPFIASTMIPFQSENLHFPLKVVSMIEQQLLQDFGQICFGGAAGAEASAIQFRLFCSQSLYPLHCSNEIPDSETPDQNGCWGTLDLPMRLNPVIFTSELIDPRCYLLGIKQMDAYDQIWLSDSWNEGL
jgi:hypothetical protein